MQKRISPVKGFCKEITVPADKSISHRAVMFNCMSGGKSELKNVLMSDDVLSTIDCMRALGAEISVGNGEVKIEKPADFRSANLYTGNSGTTTRLISGLLAGKRGEYTVDGDASIRKRPMNRVINPLSLMGADISSFESKGLCPLNINGARLKGIDYCMPVASAQVKSAVPFPTFSLARSSEVLKHSLSRIFSCTSFQINSFSFRYSSVSL